MTASRVAESLLALSQQEELVDLPKNHPLSVSEDEEDSDRERKHQKLLEAISSLDGKNRRKVAERSEAGLKVSEFNVSSEGSGEKLVLADLLEPAKTSSSPSLATVKKQLNRVKSKKTVRLPLHKEEVERILRELAFNKTSQVLSKWDPIVLKNRQANQLVFPLEKEQSAFAPIEHVLSGWTARTLLEQKVFNLLHKNKQPVTDHFLTPMEKASLKAMSLEEAKMHQAELQRARALQSYYEARAQREKKIKSKKYHKIVKKEKAKKALKAFEQLGKVNPTVALEKLEKARIMERMSLKHQNSGKWAKSKVIMAKYDLEAHQAMQEQLSKNKELMQKLQIALESEEEERGPEEVEELLIPGVVNKVQMNADGPNPWMLSSCTQDSREAETHEDLEELPEPVAHEVSESEVDEGPVAEEEILLKEFEEWRSLRRRSELSQDAELVGSQETKESSSQEKLSELRAPSQRFKENHQSWKPKASPTGTVPQAHREEPSLEEEEPLLLQRPKRVQTLEELEELEKEECSQSQEFFRPGLEGQQLERNPNNLSNAPKEKKKKEQMLDLQNLLTTKSPSVRSLAVPTTLKEVDDEEERDQKQMIKEAFAGDDVIKDFLKEKRDTIEASKSKDMDLTLPGWGKWGGMGLKPSAKKRRHFLIKAPGPPRKDKNFPNVIINEKRNIHAAAHQVQVLPYPFTHHSQFERTVQTPIGSTWNTQRAFQKLTTPKVVTKPGHIIKPIKAEDVGYWSSSRSDLSVMQRYPKQLSMSHKKQLKKNSVD
ncbi:U3 small nucleolar RNA-associated protein 14 homolog A-like [Carlito syrichta]|uniref:U3 small nucleolar RNA-associated protein 14 homolog A-like n=1 Tax=Carlito syrichta TaxID=1868482 RepID=A0A3Q0DLP2_CARSF|nr:U3 small nucleolar RNA-associated protein 14 homolog A-like [Carlito syrichta]XP_021565397.1 U3 small nucleolar RNA-associated protein 14 homolog A-like [Carlito syrichta]XP_021565398.1 U3 small nucleolar RNA-associated protein 14 homolog A-like [Carlito syrichta]XP_021565399.1 U3 small nucleolar RNA-associated protein 14 homolog A-like [Carlito syrichta]XP_021565400.1 U3 small nucleolar RNA-associated protein 14 homolog A-like [Carlito syrichta]XP_021565401.1 U3 small nucleolar RNA-associa